MKILVPNSRQAGGLNMELEYEGKISKSENIVNINHNIYRMLTMNLTNTYWAPYSMPGTALGTENTAPL